LLTLSIHKYSSLFSYFCVVLSYAMAGELGLRENSRLPVLVLLMREGSSGVFVL